MGGQSAQGSLAGREPEVGQRLSCSPGWRAAARCRRGDRGGVDRGKGGRRRGPRLAAGDGEEGQALAVAREHRRERRGRRRRAGGRCVGAARAACGADPGWYRWWRAAAGGGERGFVGAGARRAEGDERGRQRCPGSHARSSTRGAWRRTEAAGPRSAVLVLPSYASVVGLRPRGLSGAGRYSPFRKAGFLRHLEGGRQRSGRGPPLVWLHASLRPRRCRRAPLRRVGPPPTR